MELWFADVGWGICAVALAMVCLAVLGWAYRGRTSSAVGLRGPLLCKATALTLIVFCLANPLTSSTRARPGANLVAVLIDDSASLTLTPEDGSETAADRLAPCLEADARWRDTLQEHFDVAWFRQRQSIRSVHGNPADFSFESNVNNPLIAVRELQSRLSKQPTAGILWLTDGRVPAHYFKKLATESQFMGTPIFPVLVDATDAFRDLAVAEVVVNQSAFEDTPVTVLATVRHQGYDRQRLQIQIENQEQKLVAKTEIVASGATGQETVRLQLPAAHRQFAFYTCRVTHLASPASSDSAIEATLKNNQKTFVVDRQKTHQRVLYVSGRPNWEFKFLQRAIADDPQVRVSALIRMANREAKFDFRGRDGQSSNALFRGFQVDANAETERFDEPVLVRLQMQNEKELRDGFPQTAEELFRFDAVILDDLEAAFFSAAQQKLLREFVNHRGGSVLMLGGRDTCAHGGYQRTPIGEMLPVWLENERMGRTHQQRTAKNSATHLHHFRLTREGHLEPWTRLRSDRTTEQQRRQLMPAFRIASPVGPPKPAATVLARLHPQSGLAPGETGGSPALITQRFGRGKTAVLTLGDTWRWSLRKADEHDDAARFWRQTFRWLVTDVPPPVSLQIERHSRVSVPAFRVKVQAQSADFTPAENATVRLKCSHPKQPPIELTASPADEEIGYYIATFLPTADGPWTVEVTVESDARKTLGTARAGLVVAPPAEEFAELTSQRRRLEEFSTASGGRVISLAELPEFVEDLPSQAAPVMQRQTWAFWHHPFVFCLVLACLAGEWGFRRWKGLR